MTEVLVIDRNTHAGAIRRVHEWTQAENFGRELMRMVLTKQSHLNYSWNDFRQVHRDLMLAEADQENRAEHDRIYAEIEEAFLTAMGQLQERIDENNAGD